MRAWQPSSTFIVYKGNSLCMSNRFAFCLASNQMWVKVRIDPILYSIGPLPVSSRYGCGEVMVFLLFTMQMREANCCYGFESTGTPKDGAYMCYCLLL